MSFVGELIVRAREQFPDPTINYLGSPASVVVNAGVSAGGTLAGTFSFVLTALNQFGESISTSEASVTVTGPNNSFTLSSVSLPSGATGYRVYVGSGAGQENSWVSVSGSGPTTILSFPLVNPGAPPIRNTAWLPDTDGSFVSAFTVFRWLNDGLRTAGRIAGGVPDLSAFQAVAGAPMYRISGRWIRFVQAWFDGWPLSFAKKGDIFLHNPVTGVSGLMSNESFTDTTVVQLFPQPNRTGATTTLTANMSLTDSSANCTNNSLFLPLGLFQIDSEIMSYGSIGSTTVMPNLIRGLGGTAVATHLSGATITELNCRISGFRQPIEYQPGDSYRVATLPPAWEVPMVDYMVAQFRKAEKKIEEGQALEKAFDTNIKEFTRQARLQTQPVQLGSVTREVYPGGYGGGTLIP